MSGGGEQGQVTAGINSVTRYLHTDTESVSAGCTGSAKALAPRLDPSSDDSRQVLRLLQG